MVRRKYFILFYIFFIIFFGFCSYFLFDNSSYGRPEGGNNIVEYPKVRISSLPQKVQDSLSGLEEKLTGDQKFALDFRRLFAEDYISDSVPLILKVGTSEEDFQQYITDMPDFLVGLTFSDLEEKLESWQLEQLNQGQALVLSRIIEGKPTDKVDEEWDSYYLGIADGKVAIFEVEKNTERTNLLQKTELESDLLPEQETAALREGIYVSSEEELLAILEGLLSYSLD